MPRSDSLAWWKTPTLYVGMQIQLYQWIQQNFPYLFDIKNFKIHYKLTTLRPHCLLIFCFHFYLDTCAHAQINQSDLNRFILTSFRGLTANQNAGFPSIITSCYLEWQNEQCKYTHDQADRHEPFFYIVLISMDISMIPTNNHCSSLFARIIIIL